jgi:hypothetical protein
VAITLAPSRRTPPGPTNEFRIFTEVKEGNEREKESVLFFVAFVVFWCAKKARWF